MAWRDKAGEAGLGVRVVARFTFLEHTMKIEKIKWKSNVPTAGIDAEKAYRALEAIRVKNGGLSDDAIVEAAKPRSHALHKWFQWDDDKAAVEYRRQQARLLIRSITVTYEESPETTTRAYEVHTKSRPGSETRTVYSTNEEVLSDPDSRDRLIASAIRSAMEFRRRFKHLHELDMLMEEINKTLVRLGAGD
jgi:hypothetical protein